MHTTGRRAGVVGLLQLYYAATPVFWIADLVWGLRVRVAFLDQFPEGRHAYYALCCALGVAAALRPAAARRIALAESAGNILLLVLSTMLWYYRALDAAASVAGRLDAPTPAALANVVLVAGVLAVSHALRHARAAANST